MAIPDFQSIMLPLLKLLEDKQEHSLREVVDTLSDVFKLTEQERKELLPSGLQPIFENRVSWARTHLKKACLLESTRRAYFKKTDRGVVVLNREPKELNIKYLDQYEEFKNFRTVKKDKPESQAHTNYEIKRIDSDYFIGE